ncbi:hypothetical protein MHLP_03565 [Candidatus Mycoplasma haematolamae str. Purdue]|uniref:Uncharacterized protein n=1 Tax=Mycoplasma haematolamae (strain Purdue) TaxID=1212765 RepID=I7BK87_MYCHA|nr:hypothetical protein [Candidatus Mycoplasma haematolamae]AFO52293.1 hypothetical protein MHLP_03565 [Candidatus Mycoplasma haematolamae str. Purdue]
MSKKDSAGGWDQQTKLEDSQLYGRLGSHGYSKGLVSEQCSHMSGIWNTLITGGQNVANKTVCQEIFKGVFQNHVDDKRYCLAFLFISNSLRESVLVVRNFES